MTNPKQQSPNRAITYLRTEFHCHTIYSKDSLAKPEMILAACRRKKIDRLIITDHNTIQGALHAKQLDPERVIVGEEIMTTQGEILAAYVQEEIPPGLSPLETITQLRQQDAFISVSHPFDTTRKGHWQPEELLEILPLVDAIETFNARCMWPWSNWQAQKFARQHGVSGTFGSDAHAVFELGRGNLLMPAFHDAASLKAALRGAISLPVRLSAPWVHFTSRYAVWQKMKGKR